MHIFSTGLQNCQKKPHFDEFVQLKMNIFIDFSVKMWYIYCYIGQSTIINRKQSFILRKGETMAKDILDAIRAAEEECG